MLQGGESGTARAKGLRQSMSLPEILLWQALRDRPSGLKFRRQHPSGAYVADFYCHEARLVIELDGEAHDRADNPQKDIRRDAWFAARGIATLRIPAAVVLKDLDAAVAGIVAQARRADIGGSTD